MKYGEMCSLSISLSMVYIPYPILTQTPQFCQISRRCISWSMYRFNLKFWQVVCYQNKNSCDDFWINLLKGNCFMTPWKLLFSVFVIKTYSGTGKRDFNLGLSFCFFRFFFTALILLSFRQICGRLTSEDSIESKVFSTV